MNVTIADGKYTVVCDEVKGFRALRYGKEWRDLTGDNLVAELALEIEELRAAIEADREGASRIQFMADEACAFNTWKQEDGSWKYRLEWDHGTEWQTQWFDSPEEAIDNARRIDGEGK